MAKSNSEFKAIQKKLVAAVAMVLVASIMVVSSSYAWFTLSTAPEVKGITTSVGSNGNLEMALITTNGLNIENMTESVDYPNANNYWGNLVDLGYDSYHLSDISLAPARLNATTSNSAAYEKTVTLSGLANNTEYKEGGTYVDNGRECTIKKVEYTPETVAEGADQTYTAVITYEFVRYTYRMASSNFLKTAEYGTDGRISALRANTLNGIYQTLEGRSAFYETTNQYGVRVVGTSSGLTPEQIALREAVELVSSTKNTAVGLARDSLMKDSVKLAAIIVDNKLNRSQTVSETDFLNVKAAVASLESIVTKLVAAMDATVKAVGVSQGITVTSITYGTDAITATGTDAAGSAATVTWGEEVSALHTSLLGANTRISAMNNDLNSARNALTTAENNKSTTDETVTYRYTDVEAVLTSVLSTSDMTLNGNPLTGENVTTDTLAQDVFAAISVYGYIPMEIVGGMYYQIAEFTENYSATTTMTVKSDKLPAAIAPNGEVTANVVMVTKADAPVNSTYYLPYFVSSISSLSISGSTTSVPVISDYYGYAIDLAFRTNAADSYLKLQTSATSRVGDDTTASVQGGGSYMEFDISENYQTNGYTLAQMVELMEAIRVVLMNYETGEIYGLAILDMTATDLGDVDDLTEGTEYDYVDSADKAYKLTNATVTNGTTIKANLYLCNFYLDGNGKMIIEENSLYSEANANIVELVQNQAVGITSLVYLDGDYVDNGDVAINGDSVTGTMNLQFSSSAELDPMDYTFTDSTTQKLDAPTNVSISDQGVLSFTPAANATSYEIYVGGQATGKTVTESGTNLTEALSGHDLSSVAGQEVTITLVAKAEGYTASDPSGSASYTVPAVSEGGGDG